MSIAGNDGRKGMLKTRPIRNQLVSGINTIVFSITMILVVFVILTFEATAPPVHFSQGVQLPKVSHSILLPRARKDGAINITVARDSKVFYGNDLVQAEDIPPRVQDALRHGSEHKIYLKVDARAKYSVVKSVIDSIQTTGIQNIAFFAQQRQQ